ncbi:hypothetical protein SAMD00023353_0801120 [Rosellinia necatrix]|uniref:Uncharacterized protein n=1 Tax=Rosellinia necatrix TaxID=77044 RepID=A0A1W2TAZ3_ROSNE|nr:hypothetical protein SAMD00023353_0801120 [Rosellinia necatrix]
MATPNKFSNPDTPACDCLRLYVDCLIIGPLQGIFCLPFVCCARAHKNHQKQREPEGTALASTAESQPPQQPDMAMLPDASKPKDQWPAEWHSPVATGHVERAKRGGEAEDASEKSTKDKLADGVLKIATVG